MRKEELEFLGKLQKSLEEFLGFEDIDNKVDLVTDDVIASLKKHNVSTEESLVVLKIISNNYEMAYEIANGIEKENNDDR